MFKRRIRIERKSQESNLTLYQDSCFGASLFTSYSTKFAKFPEPPAFTLLECLISACTSRHSYLGTYVVNVKRTVTDVGFNCTYMYKHEPSILHD